MPHDLPSTSSCRTFIQVSQLTDYRSSVNRPSPSPLGSALGAEGRGVGEGCPAEKGTVMSTVDSTRPREGRLDGGAMSTADIVFFVLAGVAPMGVVVALLSLSIALGNGA